MIDEKDVLNILQNMIEDYNTNNKSKAEQIAIFEQYDEIYKDDDAEIFKIKKSNLNTNIHGYCNYNSALQYAIMKLANSLNIDITTKLIKTSFEYTYNNRLFVLPKEYDIYVYVIESNIGE